MNPYLELLRPNNGILAILGIVIGAIVGTSFVVSKTVEIILAIIVAFLINGAGNVINDYFDHNIDKVNRPERPIPSGRVKRGRATAYFLVLIVVSLIFSWFVSTDFFIIALVNSVISFVYSWKLKGTPLIGNIAVSWLAASTFIAGALITHNLSLLPAGVLIFGVIGFLGTLSREIFKDIEDIKGDKEHGARTLPVAIGEKSAGFVASFFLLIGIFSLVVPVYMKLFSVFYYAGIVPAIAICLLAMISMKNPHKSQKMIKIAMYFIFLGFILGTVL